MADTLQQLFASTARVKLMRLFLFNPRLTFTTEVVMTRARISKKEARRELTLLTRIGMIEKGSRKSAPGFALNNDFTHLLALQNLLLNTPVQGSEMYNRIKNAGVMKLIIIGGIFMGEFDTALDLLIVGDRIKDKKLKDKIRSIEADLGKELRYAYVSTDEFFYRLNMNDRLVRDMLDYPHKIVFDRLNIGLV